MIRISEDEKFCEEEYCCLSKNIISVCRSQNTPHYWKACGVTENIFERRSLTANTVRCESNYHNLGTKFQTRTRKYIRKTGEIFQETNITYPIYV
jgi:hypothetical protein